MALERALILNCGVQGYLNRCFASDGFVTKYSNMLQRISNNANKLDADLAAALSKARANSIKANHVFLSGNAARELLAEYTGFFDFQSPSWDGWRMVDDSRFSVCLDMLCVMQDGFHRLLHKLDLPKINLLGICNPDLGTDESNVDMEAFASIARSLRDKRTACNQCIDFAFTGPWVARLLDHGPVVALQAWLSLGDIMALLRVSSSSVEKKHLIGQEAKPRKRGICITADEAGAFTFRKLVERSADDARAFAKADCLAGTENAFQQSLTDLLCQGHADRRSEAASKATGGKADVLGKRCSNILNLEGKLKRRNTRGYDVYTRSHFHSGLEGASNFDKRKSLDSSWKSLLPAEKLCLMQSRKLKTRNLQNMTMTMSLRLFPGSGSGRAAGDATAKL